RYGGGDCRRGRGALARRRFDASRRAHRGQRGRPYGARARSPDRARRSCRHGSAERQCVSRRDGDVLHGLGAADMKGGLAVLLALADSLGRGEPRFDVTLVFYEGEEVADEFNGLRRLFEDTPALVQGDLAILLEPTGGWVEAGCQGTIHVRAGFDGVRS